LCDLYTIKKERRTIEGLKIALFGDLRYGRAVHSLTYALARFGAIILFPPSPGLEMPEHVLRKLTTEYKGKLIRLEAVNQEVKKGLFPLDAMYVTPSSAHQLAMLPDISIQIELKKTGIDTLYVMRLQKERHAPTEEGQELKKDYPVVDKKLLKGKEFKGTIVMHPLPRVDELAYELDADPRSMYFKQAARGVPIRMALIALLLGTKEIAISKEADSFVQKVDYPIYDRDSGVRCLNSNCVSNQETETRYIKPEFKIVNLEPLTLRCLYCEREVHPQYIASSEWHQGMLETKKYHSADSHWMRKIKPENLIIFDSESDAGAHGFKPSSYITVHRRGR
jgi:aspartate carbamoyltransferase catalytic subunit